MRFKVGDTVHYVRLQRGRTSNERFYQRHPDEWYGPKFKIVEILNDRIVCVEALDDVAGYSKGRWLRLGIEDMEVVKRVYKNHFPPWY